MSVALLVLLCDQLSSHIAKPYFQRFRPTHHPDFKDEVLTVLNYRGGLYGFFSGHAANSFGFATLMSLIFRNRILTIILFLFAIITAYTRIYLGVHFISDILVGMVVGIIIGWLVYKLYNFFRKYWLKTPTRKLNQSIYSNKQAYFLAAAYYILVAVILTFNTQIISWLDKT